MMEEVFVKKEKMLEQKYVDILAKIVGLYKAYEHEKLKEIKGAEIDSLLKDSESYMKRLKELREQIEKRTNEKTIEQIYEDVFKLLKGAFGEKSEEALIIEFDKEFIKKGKLPPAYLRILKEIAKAKKEFKKGKMSRHEVEDARKNASLVINHLIEFNQRKDMINLESKRITLMADKKGYELVAAGGKIFFIDAGNVSRVNIETEKLESSSIEEFNGAFSKQDKESKARINKKVFDIIQKTIGKFEILV